MCCTCCRKDNQLLETEDDDNFQLSRLYSVETDGKWPLIYATQYDISFMGLEKLHPFDAGKWGRVYHFLLDSEMITDDCVVRPLEINEDELLYVHSKKYIKSLKSSFTVAQITEVPPVLLLPNCVVQKQVLSPFRFQTGGTILAGKLALTRGWAINIGGGFHHCCANNGGGFCAYADITLCIKYIFGDDQNRITSAMIVDLDAHQGNGHERDFKSDRRVYIMDVYNRHIYPKDHDAKEAIDRKVELNCEVEDEEYLNKVKVNLEAALSEFTPQIIIFNAGTDILKGDGLGLLSVSAEGIIKRDELVFSNARKRNIPIVMVTSGGYQKQTARVIADSILNLKSKGLITITKD
uniref:Histone deacetylase 11 n=1 Tax=Strigamia maritima TaxID=126957 RepID=T1IVB9_STRMM